MRKILIFVLIFYILALLQTSFLVHFNIFSGNVFGPSLILILVIFINFFEKPAENSGIFAAFFAGFFLDVFSENPLNFFGFYIFISLAISILIKFILRKYVRFPIWKSTSEIKK